MDETECNSEWWTFYSGTNCTNTVPSTPTCTITNGTWKFQTNYARKYVTAWEVTASDISWVDICSPMPNAWDACLNRMDSCKQNNTTKIYLECVNYDTGTESCVVDTCDTWYHQVWNKCEADSVDWVCSTDPNNMTCTAGSYINLPDSSTQYKWECAGLNGGQSKTCSRTIPVVAENGSCWATHYNCSIWSLDTASSVNWSVAWTWKCKGTNGGWTVPCSETKPITYTPPVAVWNWPTAWSTSTAFDDGLFAWMSPESNYKLTWCSSHKDEITGWPCVDKKFTNVWWIATLPINGWVDDLSTITDGMWFELIWEWVLTIDTYAMDNAHNISKQQFIYKIDKTAPKFWDFVFNEESLGQYINKEVYTWTKPGTLWIKHISSDDLWLTHPLLSTYDDNVSTASEKEYHQWDVYQIRYKQAGLPLSPSPVINVALDWATDTYGGKSNFNHVSRLDRIDFYKWNSVPWGTTGYQETKFIDLKLPMVIQKNLDLETFGFSEWWTAASTLTWTWNDGTFINVRLTDNAWNYSEKAFYVYRDDSEPEPRLFSLKFANWDDLLLSSTDSKMIYANESTTIDYNWWANDHMAPNIQLITEKHNDASADQVAVLTANTFGTSSPAFNLSDVDATDINEIETGNYRNYWVKFKTPDIEGNLICDIVWNCIDWTTVFENFRVMANIIDNNTSTLSIDMPTTAFANNPANSHDEYTVRYSLRDIYSNRIRNTYLGAKQIRNVSTDLSFINGLNTSHTNNLHWWANINAVDIVGTELSWNVNLNNVVLKENNSNSNWDFEFSISSRVPTVGWYSYMSDSALLELASVENNLVPSNLSSIYQPINQPISQNELLSFNWTKVIDIESTIREEQNNRYNINQEVDLNWDTDLARYWNITSWTYNDSLFGSQWSRFNFEFASPFIYHASDLNILRDGINTEHTKYIVNNGTAISTYMIEEKFFDASNINSNTRADFYIDNVLRNSFNTLSSININNSFLAKYAAKAWENFDTWGYVSYIGYQAWDGTTYIPSISRWIVANEVWEETKASAHFPNVSSSGSVNFLTEDIAITGLVNKIDGLVNNDVQVWLASLDLERPYTRAELLERIKKKIFSVNKINKWCSWNIDDLNMSSPDHSACSFNINNEKIAFYKWDVTIDCWTWTTCDISGMNSLIVMDWRITIKSNINTNSTNWQILIASVTDKGLDNIKISNGTNNSSGNIKQWGWMSIGENVTNIDAFLLSQWPLVSSDNTWDVIINYQIPDQLLNQLHIYGSVFSLNTISWDKTWDCPYIEEGCADGDTKKVYDLSFLRRYTLVNASDFGWVSGMVPYDSSLDLTFLSSRTSSKSSWNLTYDGNWTAYGTSWLRTAKAIHIKAPVIIERDHRWTTNPSYFAQD
jgi:hypothetical protein